jgi:shikimate kinase/3-dehydroquinate synthase
VAARTGRRFVDLDEAIAAEQGEPVAALLTRDELAFRRIEASTLRALLSAGDARDLVLATGGGAAAQPGAMAWLREAAIVVELAVDLATVRARTAGDAGRPLLARTDAEVTSLLAARADAYRQAHGVVATVGRAPAEVADGVLEVEAQAARLPAAGRGHAVVAGLPGRTYPVIACAEFADVPARLAAVLGAAPVALVVDANVAACWPAEVAALVPAPLVTAIVPAGEASKSLAHFGALCEQLIAAGVDRQTTVVAVGGGVTGDLAGLVAATLLRGLRVVHVPTTLVAMTDSAIGGKTAIDLPAGKNLIGAFWQPAAVIAPLPMLATLPAVERRAGFGELWKYALLAGEGMWAQVEACAPWGQAPEHAPPPPGLAAVIRAAAAYKVGVVVRDERETGADRVLLNLGHTVGHALESETGMAHGAAVALGLVAACQVAHALGHADHALAARVEGALAATGLASDPRPLLTEAAIARLGVDKKRRGGVVRFVMPHAVGRCEPTDVPVGDIATILRSLATV